MTENDRPAPSCRSEARMAAALARPVPPSETRRLAQEIAEAIERRDRIKAEEAKDRELAEAEFHLAALLHRYVHRHCYRDKERDDRSAQWQGSLARLRPVADAALVDWLLIQIEVARNLASGIQDLRPRKDGPTWLVLLEHVANRKRKAKAVLNWLIAADKSGGATATDKTLPEALREMHLRSASEKREP
jgi:hypothetical protein